MALSIPPARHDPFVYINHDCLNLVLAHLRPLDIIRCTLVSKPWRAHIHDWISLFGLRLHWPHLYNPDAPNPIKRYTDLARLHVLHEYGEPTSVREYEHVLFYAINGDFAAWSDRQYGRVDSLHWQFLPYAEDGSIHDIHSLDISFAGTQELKVTALLLNEEGYLYASFRAGEDYWCVYTYVYMAWRRLTRLYISDALWFLPWNELIWHNSPASNRNKYKPILIGENRLYFRDSHGGELIVVDLQTKELEYTVPIEYPLGDAGCKLFQTKAKAADLIVHIHTGQTCKNKAETYTIVLTNSTTGKTHQKFTYTGFRVSFHPSPSLPAGIDRDFAIILDPNPPLQQTTKPYTQPYALIHYYSPHPRPHPRTSPPTYHPTSTSAILFPTNFNWTEHYLVAINPFTMHLTTFSTWGAGPGLVPHTLPLSAPLPPSPTNRLHTQLLQLLNNPPIPIPTTIDPANLTIYHVTDKVLVTLPGDGEGEAGGGTGDRRLFYKRGAEGYRPHGFEGVGRYVSLTMYAHCYVQTRSVIVCDYLERKGGMVRGGDKRSGEV
ncbi:hypothetical protein FQN50_001880 [Emmonsiellopsis sp. PD_5]|nr:hypothetical protein FQN50_001880 [Emmonsiellopsis sp. PD_5]